MRRLDGKQILVLKTSSEGCVDGEGVLTCQWHNWKFDLKTGGNQYGGDELRIYPLRVEAGEIWVNLADAPINTRIARSKTHLKNAFDDNRYDQIQSI